MKNKVRQITDSIHGTIYISELEYKMMSTPFFNRLNDVYQSSTVYMTFPSNRTKRFEHSLGTMELTGQMFYSAITNASSDVRKQFLDSLLDTFGEITERLNDVELLGESDFYCANKEKLGNLVYDDDIQNNMRIFERALSVNGLTSVLSDYALRKQEVNFLDILEPKETNPVLVMAKYDFVYQCCLQALRIAALFHDIGHPPFSHIIEDTLKKLSKNNLSKYNNVKKKKFGSIVNKLMNPEKIAPMLLEYQSNHDDEKAFHEQIGLNILYNASCRVWEQFLASLGDDLSDQLMVLYLVTVFEFTFAILQEKTMMFSSLHRIIDGTIDTDRLDYIVRDSRNSGVDWGNIPYSRIVNCSKLVYYNNQFKIAFPEKVSEDLDDLIVNRYKIFQRINYHHRSIKTSILMQRSVEMLAEDYLMQDEKNEILPEIRYLWTAIDGAFSLKNKENRLTQWTDSWLISILSEALSKVNTQAKRTELVRNGKYRSKESLEKLHRMLEEVLLNRKCYYPLLKRQRDSIELKNCIIEQAQLTDIHFEELIMGEYYKLLNNNDENDKSAALESLKRLNMLRDEILDVANFKLLETFLPQCKPFESIINDVLDKAMKEKLILDCFILVNPSLSKLGVSKETEILLYRQDHEIYKYDLSTSLIPKLNAQRAGALWLFIYVSLPYKDVDAVNNQLKNISNSVIEALAQELKEAIDQLFGSAPQDIKDKMYA